jgi:hypothetical protein
MYQLVPTKKKNIFLKIVIFLVGCAVIKELIVVLFGPAPVSKQLDDFTNSINKRCPLVVDSATTLNNCSAGPGNILHFNYQISIVNKEEVDTVSLFLKWREEMINRMKTDPSLAVFKNNDISLSASYYDKTGHYICSVGISPENLKGK